MSAHAYAWPEPPDEPGATRGRLCHRIQCSRVGVCRNILSFKCLGTFSISNGCSEERWVRMHVHGQSFLMNQIRKMVGLAVAVYRGVAPPEAVHWALDPTRDFSTPMAPELGLFLYESKFDSYNKMFGNERERLDLQDWRAEVEDFKMVCACLFFCSSPRYRQSPESHPLQW